MTLKALPRPGRSRVNAIVLQTQAITPHMRRIVFGGPELAAWWLSSAVVGEPAAWVKVFPPGREGRAYSICHLDEIAGRLCIDFVLHGGEQDTGSVSDWARQAKCGDQVEIVGPRSAGFLLLPDSRWLWLAADASALPAAQSILEHLPSSLQSQALLVVQTEEEQQPISSPAPLHLHWRHCWQPAHQLAAGDPLLAGMGRLEGPGQVWIAGEAEWVRSWRRLWLECLHFDRRRLSSKGYWKIGASDHRD